mgnify:CR=1 FL=1
MSGWVSFTALGIFSNIGEVEDGMRTLAREHAITDAADARTPETVQGAVTFDNVSFGYGREGAALNGFLADRKAGRVGGTTAVFAADHSAMYFSKEVIPFTSDIYADEDETPVFHHVGVYAYRPDALAAYPNWPAGRAERLEGLEQLRFMENGRKVLCVEVEARDRQFWELNNPEDVPRLEKMMKQMRLD